MGSVPNQRRTIPVMPPTTAPFLTALAIAALQLGDPSSGAMGVRTQTYKFTGSSSLLADPFEITLDARWKFAKKAATAKNDFTPGGKTFRWSPDVTLRIATVRDVDGTLIPGVIDLYKRS